VKRDWLLYLVIFSLALNLGTIGTFAYLRSQDQAQQAKVAASRPPRPLPLRALGRELGMDHAQRQALRGLFPEHHQKVAEVRRELAQKRQELLDLMRNDNTPWSAIQGKIREISSLQGTLEEEMTRFMLAVKKNLNPRQQAAFLNMLQIRMCGPGDACGPMGPGFGRHRRPGRDRGMGPGMGRGMGPEGGPPPLEGAR
jgi:Spy/CpxP family protein refolding chaperone